MYASRDVDKGAQMAFQRHPFAEERRRSAVVLIKTLLEEPGLWPKHRREFLKIALFKLTEAEGVSKYKTRLRSEASLAASFSDRDLRHDHVFQRADMVEALMQAKPGDVDEIINRAVGCTVTKNEHRLLDQFKNSDGWERYRKANIVVIDMETRKPLELPPSR